MVDVKILKDEKEDVEVEISSLTLAEILRVYLNRNSNVDFVAWKREHPTKNPILAVGGKNPKKAIKDVINLIVKDLENIEKNFAKMK